MEVKMQHTKCTAKYLSFLSLFSKLHGEWRTQPVLTMQNLSTIMTHTHTLYTLTQYSLRMLDESITSLLLTVSTGELKKNSFFSVLWSQTANWTTSIGV